MYDRAPNPRQGMPWLRGEATGLPGLRTVNLQRDYESRLESSSLGRCAGREPGWPCFRPGQRARAKGRSRLRTVTPYIGAPPPYVTLTSQGLSAITETPKG
jgi:hypothetical protein